MPCVNRAFGIGERRKGNVRVFLFSLFPFPFSLIITASLSWNRLLEFLLIPAQLRAELEFALA